MSLEYITGGTTSSSPTDITVVVDGGARSGNVDGGSASSVYLVPFQLIDGGTVSG